VFDGLSVVINGYQWISVVISGYQWLSMVISGYQWLSVVISGYQWLSVVISGYQWLSAVEIIRGATSISDAFIQQHFPHHYGDYTFVNLFRRILGKHPYSRDTCTVE
jgi:hypothetical protein